MRKDAKKRKYNKRTPTGTDKKKAGVKPAFLPYSYRKTKPFSSALSMMARE